MRAGSACLHTFAFITFVPPAHLFYYPLNRTRCQPVAQQVQNRTIWWGNYSSSTILLTSKPVCLNSNFEIKKRSCMEFWNAEPTCERFQEVITPCPEDFFYFEESEICYAIAENQTYPPDCPYPNVMSFFEYKILLERNIVELPVWFPAETLSEYGIGTMIITERSRHYGDALSINYYLRSSYGRHCLIYKGSWMFEAVYCNSTHNAICAYHPLKNVRHNYCSRNQTRPCIMSDFDLSTASCLCVRKENCEDLAELKLPHQNFISTNGSKCRIGLERQGEKYVWAKSQEDINYSNWSIEANFFDTFGAIQSDVGWTLENEPNLSCAICEEKIRFRDSSLDLKLDPINKELVLTITNIQDLLITSESDYPVFCFTDTPTTTQVRRFSESYFVSFSEVSEGNAVVRYKYSSNCPGHYWCEAFQYPSLNIIRTKKILIVDDELYGNEFATTLLVQYTSSRNLNSLFNSISVNVSKGFKQKHSETLPFYMRWMSTLNTDDYDKTIEYLVHITSKTFNPIEVEQQEFTEILSTALTELPSILYMSELLSVNFCLPSTTISGERILHWQLTKINATVIPSELCLQDDGFPVTRSCFGDFLNGAKWTPVNGTCSQNPVTSPVTELLYSLVNPGTSMRPTFENLTHITEYSSLFLTIDVHLIARILEVVDKSHATDLTQITTIINNMLNAQRDSLKLSQILLNSTDKILYNFDDLLKNYYINRYLRLSAPNFTEIEGENLILLVFDARTTAVRGIGLYNDSIKPEVRLLEKGISYEELLVSDDLEVATYIPEELLSQINDSLLAEEPLMVVMYVFMNDYLFNEEEADSRSPDSKIFGVLLPPIADDYVTPIPTIFKPRSDKYPRKCAFWNYGTSDELGSFRGRWEENDVPLTQNLTKLELCHFPHTTHYALLLLGDLTQPELEAFSNNQTVLYVITIVGCSLSILGILVILLTFFLFKRWRENKGNQILVQFGLVTVLQFCLLYVSSQVGNGMSNSWCVVVGALLHFTVLSQFCWMLVMAVLQYKRFVLVFSTPTKWMLLKACLFGYFVPSVPVIVYVSSFNENYTLSQTGMCYPTGYGLYFGVLLPGGCIVISNLIIFCVIIWNIFYRKLDNDYSHEYTLRFRLVFVLFFMLGITWIFGFVAELTHNLVFAYLFCLTASFQGFIMFLAFIVCNESTRKMYVYLIKTIKYKLNF